MATKQQQIDFINRIAPVIKAEGNKRGYKIVSVFIAMACKEGNFGESKLAKLYFNHFGMKAGKGYTGKVVSMKTMEEYKVGVLTQIVDGFRVFGSDYEGVAGKGGFFDFISTKRYAKVKEQTTPLAVVTELKNAGYMTSSIYVESIMNDYIKKFNLTKYDDIVSAEPTKNEYPTLSLGMKDSVGGKYIESWQNYLSTLGMLDIKNVTRGVFDTYTHFAVRQFQESKGLKVDGIIGKKTWGSLNLNK